MNVLIIGSGAREHAMAWAAARNDAVQQVYVAPGNGGTALMGGKVQNVALKATALDELLEFAVLKAVDLTIAGSEQPLELGIVDLFRSAQKKIIGPSQAAAQLETSKVFAKDFMSRYGIPTAGYHVFREFQTASLYLASLDESRYPQVIKASGLCAGKGVIVASDGMEAFRATRAMFEDRVFGDAADEVVIEDFLEGEEASVFVLTDGEKYRMFYSAQDHKRIGEGDTGKNTGGMGAYAPAPLVTSGVMKKIEEQIVVPALEGMAADGTPYTGFLYVGVMIDKGEPSVVEFNARMGDPETQVVLPLLKDDFIDALQASLQGTLDLVPFEMLEQCATTVVIASKGYPDLYETGREITIDSELFDMRDVLLFHAGTEIEKGTLRTSGGRVFSVTALGKTLMDSIELAYRAVDHISFEGACFRRDIGAKAL
ncbi:phosphoribosylamine--glycine ligase [Chlorobium phaeobacteroides]|uniref:Phosphoribosylamine--glycine ligase n=1 Tax=Chlorobium phaeobacteroides (strain DSM 266 / SMG 266 / 2430) TaxID=290317 RepID=A1BDV8_CHLPD|nr:phosphoribosylamine--glycine ligase [Chlorobium phaeobacteroides]ABL64585.1 phosphoribosylamine--glycine ligase [Chlorobium phaeobacteroides DSM 266]